MCNACTFILIIGESVAQRKSMKKTNCDNIGNKNGNENGGIKGKSGNGILDSIAGLNTLGMDLTRFWSY